MSRVQSFFLREAGECLAVVGREVERESMELSVVYGAVRRLRGSAQMARFEGVAGTARALEQRLRPYAGGGRGGESEEAIRREVREVLRSLRTNVEAVREGRLEADPRMGAEMEARQEQNGREGQDGQDGQEGQEGQEVVPVETLEYRGEAALGRALELRPAMEDVVESAASRGVLDELFDLIRLGAK